MKKGFTLIELILVIALIAIVATLAVTKVGDLRQRAQRQISLANQQAVGRAVDLFLTVNNGRLDRLDSLLDEEAPISTTPGFLARTGSSQTYRGQAGFYQGPDKETYPLTEPLADRNNGLTPKLVRQVLTPYVLSPSEATALNNWGFVYALRHATSAVRSPRDTYPSNGGRGDDGAYLSSDLATSLDPHESACIPWAFTNTHGRVVAAISPFTSIGRAIYREMGQKLLETDSQAQTDESSSTYNTPETVSEVLATGGALLAFGLGNEATIIGHQTGGLESAPYATYPAPQFYRQYILLFRIDTSNPSGKVSFAGVLDPCGNTIRMARQAL